MEGEGRRREGSREVDGEGSLSGDGSGAYSNPARRAPRARNAFLCSGPCLIRLAYTLDLRALGHQQIAVSLLHAGHNYVPAVLRSFFTPCLENTLAAPGLGLVNLNSYQREMD